MLQSWASTNIGANGASQDRVVLRTGEDQQIVLIGLADGTGGMVGGKSAVELFVQAFETFASERLASSERTTAETWLSFLCDLDLVVSCSRGGGECTAVVLEVRNGVVSGASVGDSEAWLILENGHVVLTQQQSRKPRIGSSEAQPVFFCHACERGSLVVGSDGLFSFAKSDQILHAVRASIPELAIEKMVTSVQLRSGALPDDLSIAIVGFDYSPILVQSNP